MTSRYAHRDAYTYEDSSVLRNKAGHRSQEALERFERLSVANRMMEDPPDGGFDYAHLKTMHFHLFQDVYEWAGEERNVSVSKGSTQFANPRFIANNMDVLLQELAAEDRLRQLPMEQFAARVAHYVLELNMAHPFREGNGRVIRYFLSLLANNAGYDLDAELLKSGWVKACVEGVCGGEEAMRQTILESLIRLED